jgi:hypothetical protein
VPDSRGVGPRSAKVRRHAHPRDGVRVRTPAPRELWKDALALDPDARVSQTPEWIDCICAFGGYRDASRLYELPGGRQLVLPMVRHRDLPGRWASEASLPAAWEPCGIVAPGSLRVEDVVAVLHDLARRASVRISLRPGPLHASTWAAAHQPGTIVVPRLAHVLELDGGFARVWAERFTGAARTAMRKAERSGLTVERDTSGRLVPVVQRLFESSLDRWAAQQREPRPLARWRGHRRDSARKLELITGRLGEACRIWVAWRDRQPAAAIVVFQAKNASYARGMMDKELAGPTRANYLLHRLAIEDACDAGCRFYDMGESGGSVSLAQFKTRFGARPRLHADYHIERLPITAVDRHARGVVKRIVGFQEEQIVAGRAGVLLPRRTRDDG